MLTTKLFEVRDAMTFIPIIAIELNGDDHYLLRHAGYGRHRYISIANLNKGNLTYDEYGHGPSRTMHVAHKYIKEHWDELSTGDVIDVEYILGMTPKKKESAQVEKNGEYAR
jgi:hypothetical protein